MYTVYSYGGDLPVASTSINDTSEGKTTHTRNFNRDISSSATSETLSTETGLGYGAVTQRSGIEIIGKSVLHQSSQAKELAGRTFIKNSQGFYRYTENDVDTYISTHSISYSYSSSQSYKSSSEYSKSTAISSGSNDDISWGVYTGRTVNNINYSSTASASGFTRVDFTTLYSFIYGVTQNGGNWESFSSRISYSTRESVSRSYFSSARTSQASGGSTYFGSSRSNVTSPWVTFTTSSTSSFNLTSNTEGSTSTENTLTAGTSRNIGDESFGTYSEFGLQNGTYFTRVLTSTDSDYNITRFSSTSESTTSFVSSTFVATISTLAGKTISSTTSESYSTSSSNVTGTFPTTYASSSVAVFDLFEGFGDISPYEPRAMLVYMVPNPCDNVKVGEFNDFSYLSTYNIGATSTSTKRIKTYSIGSTGTVQSTFTSSGTTVTRTQTTSSTLFSTSLISTTVGSSIGSSNVWFRESDLDSNAMISNMYNVPNRFPCSSLKEVKGSVLIFSEAPVASSTSTNSAFSTNNDNSFSSSTSSVSYTDLEEYNGVENNHGLYYEFQNDSYFGFVPPTIFVAKVSPCEVWNAPNSLGTFNSF